MARRLNSEGRKYLIKIVGAAAEIAERRREDRALAKAIEKNSSWSSQQRAVQPARARARKPG